MELYDGMRVRNPYGEERVFRHEDGWRALDHTGMDRVSGSPENREAFIREALRDGWYVPVGEHKPVEPETKTEHDTVAHPKHYTAHPSGVECIQITEHMGFNLGNAVKYIWRCDLKQDAIEDLKKARWYIDREIAKREREAK